ncbi:MAG TPA: hydrogenase 2 operon protein HybA [Clostridia bacterium]|nr:hydrogenase 2 operon protein HybA [Clostridia bacterium]
MAMTRREAFKNIAKGALPVLAAGCVSAAVPQVAHAEEAPGFSPEAESLLYDATKCVGCKACMVGCSTANNLEPDTRVDGLHQAPPDLNYYTKNIIKLYKSDDQKEWSYFKQQCMHCADPACVAACMFAGLTKDEKSGVVSWNGSKCVGCRYCEVACPFSVPTFQWEGYNPKIVKCELCNHRTAKGEKPGCVTVCPTNAVIYGKREALLAEAKNRIKANPGKYFENRVYGEEEGGGTQVLYLSHVSFDKIGLPNLGKESIPHRLHIQHMLYKYLALPAVLYVTMAAVIRKNFGHHKHHLLEEQKKTGLRPQL